LIYRTYGVFGAIRGLFFFVQVGARFPRPHLVDMFSDSLLYYNNIAIQDLTPHTLTTSGVRSRSTTTGRNRIRLWAAIGKPI